MQHFIKDNSFSQSIQGLNFILLPQVVHAHGCFSLLFVILLLRRQKDTARLFMLLIGIGVVQSFFNPYISHAGHAGGFVGGVLLTLLIVPLVDKPEPPQQQSPQPWQNGRY